MKPDGEIVAVNGSCRELLGVTRDELVNRNLMDPPGRCGKKRNARPDPAGTRNPDKL